MHQCWCYCVCSLQKKYRIRIDTGDTFHVRSKKRNVDDDDDLIIPAHTHTRLTDNFPGLPRWAGTRKAKPIWILLKQETVSGSGISWNIWKSAPRSRQITMPAPHHSVFLQAGCPSCRRTNSVKALKADYSSNSSVIVCVWQGMVTYDTVANLLWYDTRCYFNVRSKADMSQLNLPHGTDNRETKK